MLSEIEQSIKRKIEAVGVPLKDWDIKINRGILTGCNDAFVVDGETKDRLISEDPHSAEIIRPILRGRDISRYSYDFNDAWLIASHNGYTIGDKRIAPVSIENYPAIKAHLDKYWQQICTRGDKGITPYNLRNCAYMDDLNKQKIVWGELSDQPKFAFDYSGDFTPLNTVFLMTGDNLEYLIAFLNSPVSKYFFSHNIATSSGVGTTRWLKYTIETLPIPKVNNVDYALIAQLVTKLLNCNNPNEVNKLISQIDDTIYQLYGFNDDERRLIEKSATD